MSTELGILNKVKLKRDFYSVDIYSLTDKMLDCTKLFSGSDLKGRLIVLDMPSVSTVDNVDPFNDSSGINLYKFNNDLLDYSTKNNATNPLNITYSNVSAFGPNSIVFNSSEITMYDFLSNKTHLTISYWINSIDSLSKNILSTVNVGQSGSLLINNYSIEYWDSTLTKHIINLPIEPNKWNNVIITISGSIITAYYNSVLVSAINMNNTVITQTFSGIIGKADTLYANYLTEQLTSSIDQFRIFSKAIVQSEIDILYIEEK